MDLAADEARLQARHEELLFAWDGADRYLGRVLTVGANTLTFVDPIFGAPVTTQIGGTGAQWGFPGIWGLSNTVMYFAGSNCTGAAISPRSMMRSDSQPTWLLDPLTGTIYSPTGGWGTHAYQSSRDSLLGSCTNTTGSSDAVLYEQATTISPFTPGVSVAPMVWE